MQLNHRLILISTANFFQLVSLLGPEGAPLIDEIMEEEARKKNDYSILSEQERDLIRAFRMLTRSEGRPPKTKPRRAFANQGFEHLFLTLG